MLKVMRRNNKAKFGGRHSILKNGLDFDRIADEINLFDFSMASFGMFGSSKAR
ncbi:MAG: hypothetical protein HC834_01965 [Rhodospirillales bacterium]|nr:hypothetical protein [Rhodospirillales bacterium]